MMKPAIPCCLAAVLTGCTSLPAEESTAAPELERAPVEGAPTPAPADAKADAPADAKAEPTPAKQPTPAASLHVIARSEAGLRLHPLVDGTLLVSAGPLVIRVDERGELVHDLSMLTGLESIRPWVGPADDEFMGVQAWGAVALGGRWPDAVYLSLDVASGFRSEGGVPVVYRHNPNGWAKLGTRSTHYEHYPAELHPWIEGSILARRVYIPYYAGQEQWEGDEGGPTERQVAVAAKAIAAAKKLVVIRGTPKAPDVAATVVAFDSRETGEVFAVTGDTPPVLVRLDAAGARHTVALPGNDVSVSGVIADATDRAWVFGMTSTGDDRQPWLVRLEGERATPAEPPACSQTGLASFVVLPSGAQWATCGDPAEIPLMDYGDPKLWHRPAGGAWTQPPLPPSVKDPRQVVARADDDVWVVASDEDGAVLLHSRPRATLLELPSLEVIGRQMLEWNDPRPVDKACSYPYVPLRSPPAEAERVKAALDGPLRKLELTGFGLALVSTTIRGQPQLGLQLLSPETPGDAKRVTVAAKAALGKDMVDMPRCWFATEAESGPLMEWKPKDPP